MKRSRDGEQVKEEEDEEKEEVQLVQIEPVAITVICADGDEEEGEVQVVQTEPVLIIVIYDDPDLTTTSVVHLYSDEIALLVPKFVGSGPVYRQNEVSGGGLAARVLRKIFNYEVDDRDDTFFEDETKDSVIWTTAANTRARTIVCFGYQ